MTPSEQSPAQAAATTDPQWGRFMDLVKLARTEPVPAVDVVAPVLQQISVASTPAFADRERTVIWAAGLSTLIAASLLLAVWTATSTLSDPSLAWFPHVDIALLERP